MDSDSLTLKNLLDQRTVTLQFAAADAEEVIRYLAQLLESAGYVKSSFAQAALDREAVMPTGLELGGEYHAAIPHTDIEHVLKPAVAMATLSQTVIFRNMITPEVEVPVRLVFLLALEQPKSQIEMLQQVAAVLQNAELVAELVAAEDINTVQLALSRVSAS